jgi:hypothetical protein
LGPAIINHNLNLKNPNAFIITVFDEVTNKWLTPDISAMTSNSLSLTGSSLTLNARVNIQRNEPCGSNDVNVCSYELLTAFNTTQTLSDGSIVTVSGGTGLSNSTWQGISGYSIGNLEDDEKMNFAFSAPVKRLRVTIESCDRNPGYHEQMKLFVNGAPYAVQSSQLTTPITAGGRFQLIDGGFTLEGVPGADDASGVVIIEPVGGISSFSAQNINIANLTNGCTTRIEALICK